MPESCDRIWEHATVGFGEIQGDGYLSMAKGVKCGHGSGVGRVSIA